MFDGISREIREWIKFLENRHAEPRDLVLNAIDALYLAMSLTRFHLAKRATNREDTGGVRELIEAWHKAGVAALRVNPNFAEELFEKSSYWADPERYSSEVASVKIKTLDELQQDVIRLMGEYAHPSEII